MLLPKNENNSKTLRVGQISSGVMYLYNVKRYDVSWIFIYSDTVSFTGPTSLYTLYIKRSKHTEFKDSLSKKLNKDSSFV